MKDRFRELENKFMKFMINTEFPDLNLDELDKMTECFSGFSIQESYIQMKAQVQSFLDDGNEEMATFLQSEVDQIVETTNYMADKFSRMADDMRIEIDE